MNINSKYLLVLAIVLAVGVMMVFAQIFITDMLIQSKQQKEIEQVLVLPQPDVKPEVKPMNNVLIPPLTNMYIIQNGKVEQWTYYSWFLGRTFPRTTGAYTRKGIVLQTIENGQYAAVRMEKYEKIIQVFKTADLIPIKE